MLTGSMMGNVTCQNDCHAARAVDLGCFQHILGHRLQPGEQDDHDEGIETQASIASMLKRATQGEAKNAGLSHPR